MKKLVLLLAALGAMGTGYSQKLKDAKKSLEDAQKFLVTQNQGDAVKKVSEAKETIEALLKDPKNANDAEYWYYKAAIYTLMQEISQFQSADPYKEASVALEKAVSLNKKKTMGIEGSQNLFLNNGFYSFNDAISAMNTNKFTDAAKQFEVAYNLLNVDNGTTFKDMKQVDTIKAKALYYGGVSSYYGEDYSTAIKSLDLAMKSPIVANESNLYLNLANSYGKMNQKDKQLAVIEKGKKLFPSEGNIIAAEINYYIDAGQAETVIEKLESEIKAHPAKDDYPYSLGLTYLQLSEKNKDKPEELSYLIKANEQFQNAKNLKSSNVDYAYGVGSTAFNIAATINNQMVDMKDKNQLKKLGDDRDKYFKLTMDNLKIVNDFYKSKDKNSLSSSEKNKWDHALKALSNVYANMDMMDDYNEIQKQLNK